MYIVVSVHPNDRECCDSGGMLFHFKVRVFLDFFNTLEY